MIDLEIILDHPGALNPMTSVLTRDKREDRKEEEAL